MVSSFRLAICPRKPVKDSYWPMLEKTWTDVQFSSVLVEKRPKKKRRLIFRSSGIYELSMRQRTVFVGPDHLALRELAEATTESDMNYLC